MRRAGLFVICAIALAGCAQVKGLTNRVTFDGVSFRGSAKAVDRSDRSEFDVTIRRVSQSVEGARQAAEYEATRYCIDWYGTSDIAWDMAPDAEDLPIEDDALVLRGRCVE